MYYDSGIAILLWIVGTIMGGLAYIIVQVIIAKRMEYVAQLKGYDKTARVFWMVFIFNIIGIIYAIALPDLNKRKILERIASSGQNNTTYSSSKAEKYDDLPRI
ncbi:MAG: hypothetical protein J6E46_05195 [Faecalicoccus sp.]|nr:hypothetical protein [Faecalicoccus sp.]